MTTIYECRSSRVAAHIRSRSRTCYIQAHRRSRLCAVGREGAHPGMSASNKIAHHIQACCSTLYECDHNSSVSVAAGSGKLFIRDLVQASFPSSSTLELKGVSTTAQYYGAGEQISHTSSFFSCESSFKLCWRTVWPDRDVSVTMLILPCIRVIRMAAGLTRMQVCTRWYIPAHPVLDRTQSISKCKILT